MKKCPTCNDFIIYDDSVEKCPICNTYLIYKDEMNFNQNRTINNAINSIEDNKPTSDAPEFQTGNGLRQKYRGIVTEINSNSRFHNRTKKIINSIFNAEPYQFGNTSQYTVIRIEEMDDSLVAGRRKDLIFYGDIENQINRGDDIEASVITRRNKIIITNLYNYDTNSTVRPSPQIPSGVVWIILLLLIALLIILIVGIVNFVASGALMFLVRNVFLLAIIVLIMWWIIKGMFNRK